MIKAIFFDIDGTLVSLNTHEPSKSTLRALKKAGENGIKLFIATGRNLLLKRERGIIDTLPPFDGYCSVNGQLCTLADGTVIFSQPLDREDVLTLARLCQQVPFGCRFCESDYDYVGMISPEMREFYNAMGYTLPPVEELSRVETHEVFSVSPYLREKDEYLFKPLLKHSDTTRWHPCLTDVIPLGGGKDVGIDKTLEYFGINLCEAMAIGDGGNDVSMIKHAGVGVAMGNADDSVKLAADYIAPNCDDDGIERTLRHFGII